MLVLGLNGSLDLEHEAGWRPDIYGLSHDAATALVEDGRVIAAVEEERLDRIKHSNRLPVRGIKFCLDQRGIGIGDLDRIAVFAKEQHFDDRLMSLFLADNTQETYRGMRDTMSARLSAYFGQPVDPAKIEFVKHHHAHCVSTYALSGFDDALVVSFDRGGDDNSSGMIASVRGTTWETVRQLHAEHSLGELYVVAIELLGFKMFDEYKVMGLAPYGDPSVYRSAFSKFYELKADGGYATNPYAIKKTLYELGLRRLKSEPFLQKHKDASASLQEALEAITMHMLCHWQKVTGHERLCMAGGVSHNCTMNGKILRSGLFESVFVQPAAHDAGTAIGAALDVQLRADPSTKRRRITDVYWGPDLPADAEIERVLSSWSSFVTFEKSKNVIAQTAELLASGSVIGWVQGRSEFGPRALGNRSILADPRPASNKDLINAMVKKREGFRPFAPAVLEEDARTWFDIPPNAGDLAFMVFVLPVQPTKREVLGAVTHVDGTARVQTVSKSANPRFWGLIDGFKQHTGVPVLLNTSFNNNAEPIVDSVYDAVVCFLTTELNHLVVGDYIVKKRELAPALLLKARLELPLYLRLHQARVETPAGSTVEHQAAYTYQSKRVPLTAPAHAVLMRTTGAETIGEIIAATGVDADVVLPQLWSLWQDRVVRILPA